jgi:hypothetical protein
MEVPPLPEFWRETVQVSGSPVHDALVADTRARFEYAPITPNRNPASTTAAIRVTAMSIRVATTGETPFLFPLLLRGYICLKFSL